MSEWSSFEKDTLLRKNVEQTIENALEKYLQEVSIGGSDTSGFLGVGKAKKTAAPVTPEETALTLRAAGELEKVKDAKGILAVLNSTALQALKDPATALMTLGQEKVHAMGKALGSLMIKSDYDAVDSFLESLIGRGKGMQSLATTTNSKLDKCTGYGRKNTRDLLFSGNSAMFEERLISEAELTRDFLDTLGTLMGGLFKKRAMPYAHQRFLVGVAIEEYWNVIMASNPQGLAPDLWENAKIIGKYAIQWLQQNISGAEVEKEKEAAVTDLEKSREDPEVQKLLSGPTEEPGTPKALTGPVQEALRWQQLAGIKKEVI